MSELSEIRTQGLGGAEWNEKGIHESSVNETSFFSQYFATDRNSLNFNPKQEERAVSIEQQTHPLSLKTLKIPAELEHYVEGAAFVAVRGKFLQSTDLERMKKRLTVIQRRKIARDRCLGT